MRLSCSGTHVLLFLIAAHTLSARAVFSENRRTQLPSSPSEAQDSTRQGRIAPPAALGCSRNNLTSYNGRIVSYSRTGTRIRIRVRTDWNTTEDVVIRYAKKADPARWFLINGEEFKQSDWALIESRRGKLKRPLRANVWVCGDGSNAVVDWRPDEKYESYPGR